ncbi:putative uncharacterized protein C7orf78 homolog [Hyperolius riggenbachi]|uniref:putative uncharacterized protein C7orf78 homolog n=1 Tax=Hyperolius riggenbachi TaxID=752182 RepID=UPI0035A34CC1
MCAQILHPSESENRCLFRRRVRFDADESLAVERSEHFATPKPIPEYNIWKKKPPDFSLHLYRSLRRSSDYPSAEQKTDIGIDRRQRNERTMMPVPPCCNQLDTKEPVAFLTRFKPIGPLESSLTYVRHGVYPKDRFHDAKPHDFRQYETGLTDFVTSRSRDPFNLKLKTQSLSTLYELPPIETRQRRDKVKRFILYKPADPEWKSDLILPKSPYPPKSASYSRHRRRRGVYTAFMDRVEEKFTADNQKNLS